MVSYSILFVIFFKNSDTTAIDLTQLKCLNDVQNEC